MTEFMFQRFGGDKPNILWDSLCLISLITYIIGHAVHPVFHVSKSKNQIYIFTLKFLVVLLCMDLIASCASNLDSDHLLLSKGCMRLNAHLWPTWRPLKWNKSPMCSLVYLLSWVWKSTLNIVICHSGQFAWKQTGIDLFWAPKWVVLDVDWASMTSW